MTVLSVSAQLICVCSLLPAFNLKLYYCLWIFIWFFQFWLQLFSGCRQIFLVWNIQSDVERTAVCLILHANCVCWLLLTSVTTIYLLHLPRYLFTLSAPIYFWINQVMNWWNHIVVRQEMYCCVCQAVISIFPIVCVCTRVCPVNKLLPFLADVKLWQWQRFVCLK
jgi:hypothetical protein